MSTQTAVTFDLDGTLLFGTQDDYEQARNRFAEVVSEAVSSVSFEEAYETQKEYSGSLLDEYGLSKERFPEACVQAAEELGVSDNELLRTVREIGETAFKTQEEYSQRGLADGGAAVLDTVANQADVSILTAGDRDIQQRKIDGLEIPETVATRIVGMGEKSGVLSSLSEEYERVIHIGNSESSDVQAAAAAAVDCIYIPNEEWQDDDIDTTDIETFHVCSNLYEAEARLKAYLSTPKQ